jgi:hypothetical protein
MGFAVPDDVVLVPDDVVLVPDDVVLAAWRPSSSRGGNDLSDSPWSARLLLELETVPEAFAVAAGAPEVAAVGVKCCPG